MRVERATSTGGSDVQIREEAGQPAVPVQRYGYHPTTLAKKARTPAPPRPVQAPKRRDSKKRQPTTAATDRKARWLLYGLAALGPIALVAVLLAIFAFKSNGGGTHNSSVAHLNLASLPGMRRTRGPWDAGYNGLPDRLKPIGLTALPQEALQQHIHQHLDIYIDGRHVVPPAGIGIYDNTFITELHSHSAGAEGLPGPSGRPTGVIHVESPTATNYELGQYFGAWGVYLSPTCIGGYCAKPGKPFKVYVNGKLWRGDPVKIPLKEHEEIAIVYGKAPAKVPSSFAWPSGL
jgi:hypothetical protein